MFRMSRLPDGEPQRMNSKRFKSKKRNFESKENFFRGPREPLSSYWIQLFARCGGRTTLTSHSSPRSLLSAHTKLRTTGLLTGWGKVMLPAGLPSAGGTGWQLTGRMERESSPVCHISPPNLIPATISLNNNLLPNWKARSNPAPARRWLSPPKQKGCLTHETPVTLINYTRSNELSFLLSFGYLCPLEVK